ncbi:iron complex outermembrane receptor protein [Paucibacter oligotrophus]|uniref:Iron complex outermembrane receptor protein n=1 Tax=Roseateles oligotrophus TaxID=1769250 RepID=A0A840LFE8_9BURK|nr:TonB-dependent siderophore receptor [Roseateles oligotrophus]MBB4845725.1 iron complex outermembrane receptor protein [Roseateles oligotrophus]
MIHRFTRHRSTALACKALLAGLSALPAWAQPTEASEAAPALPIVRAKAQAGPAAKVYPGGQVATEGRLGLLGEKDFMETPFSTISYTSQRIADRQAKDITEVIAATDPTVFSNGVTGAWSENYSIRGFAANTGDVMVGGLFGMAPFYRSSPEMFERIEVLKGPSALLMGMPPGGSVGGAINLVPKRAGDEALSRLTTTYLSQAQLGAHLDLGRRFGERKQLGLRFNAVYRDGEGAVKQQDKKVQLAALGLDWRGERVRWSADLYRSEDFVAGPARGIVLAAGVAVPRPPRPDILLNPPWGHVQTRDQAALLRGEFQLAEQLQAHLALGSSKTRYEYNGAMAAELQDSAGTYLTRIGQLAFDVDKRSAELGLRGRVRTGAVDHQLSLSLTHYEHQQNDYGRRRVPGSDWTTNLYQPVWGPAAEFIAPPIFKTALRLNSYGVADTLSFAQQRLQLTLGLRRQQVLSDNLNVDTGALVSRYEQGATTPVVALLFKASDSLSLYANYIEGLSQGAKAPMGTENAGDEFPPYKTQQKELGLKLDQGEFVHTLSLYEISRPSSMIDPLSKRFSFGGEQRNRGVDWSFFGTAQRGLRLMGGLAYVDPKLTRSAGGVNQGRQATGVPKWQAKLGAEWDLAALPGLTLTAGATAMSRQYISADNALSVPGRTIYDIGARHAGRLAGQPLTLRAQVANVTNKAYWGMPLLSSLALGAPRTVMVSAALDF